MTGMRWAATRPKEERRDSKGTIRHADKHLLQHELRDGRLVEGLRRSATVGEAEFRAVTPRKDGMYKARDTSARRHSRPSASGATSPRPRERGCASPRPQERRCTSPRLQERPCASPRPQERPCASPRPQERAGTSPRPQERACTSPRPQERACPKFLAKGAALRDITSPRRSTSDTNLHSCRASDASCPKDRSAGRGKALEKDRALPRATPTPGKVMHPHPRECLRSASVPDLSIPKGKELERDTEPVHPYYHLAHVPEITEISAILEDADSCSDTFSFGDYEPERAVGDFSFSGDPKLAGDACFNVDPLETPLEAARRRKREAADREIARITEATKHHLAEQPIRRRPSPSPSPRTPDVTSALRWDETESTQAWKARHSSETRRDEDPGPPAHGSQESRRCSGTGGALGGASMSQFQFPSLPLDRGWQGRSSPPNLPCAIAGVGYNSPRGGPPGPVSSVEGGMGPLPHGGLSFGVSPTLRGGSPPHPSGGGPGGVVTPRGAPSRGDDGGFSQPRGGSQMPLSGDGARAVSPRHRGPPAASPEGESRDISPSPLPSPPGVSRCASPGGADGRGNETPRQAARRRKLEAADHDIAMLKAHQADAQAVREMASQLRESHSRSFTAPFARGRPDRRPSTSAPSPGSCGHCCGSPRVPESCTKPLIRAPVDMETGGLRRQHELPGHSVFSSWGELGSRSTFVSLEHPTHSSTK